MKQEMNKYTKKDEWVWNTLFRRQHDNLKQKGCKEYLNALIDMRDVLNANSIPNFKNLNNYFLGKTGWQIEVVKGLIPVEDFFELLAKKRFCSSTWLRSPENLDYLEEPDMFHDIFGHIPLLSHPVFSDFAFEFGKLGKKYIQNKDAIIALQRLYWFSIEFGVIRENELKAYGAGIISSFGETNRATSNTVKITDFDIEQVMNKNFRTDVMQEEYVSIYSFDELFSSIEKADKFLNKKRYELEHY